MAPEFQMRRGAVKAESVLVTSKIAQAIFDTAGNDSAGVSNKTIAAHGLGVFLPIGAIIVNSFYQIKTTMADGASNNATLALSVNAANDLVSAIAISDGTTPWTAGLHGCLAGNAAEATVAGDTAVLAAARAAGSYIGALSAEKELVVTVGVHALTAGKMIVFVEYVQGL